MSAFLTLSARCFSRPRFPESLALKCDWFTGLLISFPLPDTFIRLSIDLLVFSFPILLFYYRHAPALQLFF